MRSGCCFIPFFFFFDELETLLKKGKTELQGPPGLFQNDGRETSRAIPKIRVQGPEPPRGVMLISF